MSRRDPQDNLASKRRLYKAVIDFNDDAIEAVAYVRISPRFECSPQVIDMNTPTYPYPRPDDVDWDEASFSIETYAQTSHTTMLRIQEEDWCIGVREARYGEDRSEFRKAICTFAQGLIDDLDSIDTLKDPLYEVPED